MSEIKTNSPYEYTMDDNILKLETVLNLKKTIGFPYYNYKYYNMDWTFEDEYDKFIMASSTLSSRSGKIYDEVNDYTYFVTIIFYKNQYYVQVDKDWGSANSNVTSSYNTSYFTYKSALEYAYYTIFE